MTSGVPVIGPQQRVQRIEAAMRVVDVLVAGVALAVIGLPLLALAAAVWCSSRGPAFFVHERVGRGGRPFGMWKLRTMVAGAPTRGPSVTRRGDPRVTSVGRFLRATKLDELPQLWNVFKGDMSLVGPRPEVASMVVHCSREYSVLHQVRPGITSPAALIYSREEELLPDHDTEAFYLREILPKKLALDLRWLRNRTVIGDLELLLRTALVVLRLRRSREPLRWPWTAATRSWTKVCIDAGWVGVAWVAATLLRFDGWPTGEEQLRMFVLAGPWMIASAAASMAMGTHRALWRFFSGTDAWRIAGAAIPVALGFAALRAGLPESGSLWRTPYSIIAMTALASLGAQSASRLLWSGVAMRAERRAHPRHDLMGRAILCGAGRAGQRVVSELRAASGSAFQPLAFFDDDPVKRGRSILGVRVEGALDDVGEALERMQADWLLIAIHRIPEHRLRPIVEAAHRAGVRVRILPTVYEHGARADSTSLRELAIEDLIGRSEVRLDPDDSEIARTYRDRVVLVTGAGGSIGSELVRQLVRVQPRRLILLDKDENALFALGRELEREAPRQPFDLVIRDLRNRRELARLFRRVRPEVVLHAAAHKHVPLMEANPVEAVANNVLGTQVLVRLAAAAQVESFVFVSTDKAVRPINIMGATKRAGELLVRDFGRRGHPFAVVRFGNVLGSRGSVVETFVDQIDRGGPVTVHHPEVERFFLSIPEAAQLVLVAGARRADGVYVLEMGRPRRIEQLARDLIALRAPRPEAIPVVYTSMRANEKLSEELSVQGALTPVVDAPGLCLAHESPCDSLAVSGLIADLRVAVRAGEGDAVRDRLAHAPVGLRSTSGAKPVPEGKVVKPAVISPWKSHDVAEAEEANHANA